MIKNTSAYIKLNKKALANNLEFVRKLIGSKPELSCVVKGNAYGHGIHEMLPVLEAFGVRHFSVFSSFEARQAHEIAQEGSCIMLMGDIVPNDREWVIRHHIHHFVYNLYGLQKSLDEAKRQNTKAQLHLELETGMHRHGLEEEAWGKVIGLLEDYNGFFELRGMCTHFSGAESTANFSRIKMQQAVLKRGIDRFKAAGFQAERLHTNCSAGILNFPEFNFDMVRVGILLYGLWPSRESRVFYRLKNPLGPELQPVLSWYSTVMEIKAVKSGNFIGYGTSFLADKDMRIASIPVGYGYGYTRRLSNTGFVLFNGKRLPLVGIVNMNMFVVDVTDVDIEIGEEVVLIGKSGEEEIFFTDFGNYKDRLSFELMARLDKTFLRIVE